MSYKFNEIYNIRLEFFGGLLTCPQTKKEYILNFPNAIFLFLLKNGICVNDINEFLQSHNYKDKIELDSFIKMGVIYPNNNICKKTKINKNLIKELKIIKNKNYLSFPISASLYLTYKCQLNCYFCYFKDKRLDKNKSKELNLLEWKDIILQLKSNNISYISLLGGEPTLFSEIDELLKFLENENMITTITTNGRNVSEELKKLLQNQNLLRPQYLCRV